MYFKINPKEHRKPEHEINDIFINRWSPRAMSGKAVDDKTIHKLLEAARWAPSSYNEQPWRFIIGKKGGENFKKLHSSLVDFNKMWCKNAGALILVTSNKKHANGNDYWSHSFDAGSAWMSIALQASEEGVVCHGMSGMDFEKLRKDFDVPDSKRIEMMIALGHAGNQEDLPEQARVTPNGRKKVSELITSSD